MTQVNHDIPTLIPVERQQHIQKAYITLTLKLCSVIPFLQQADNGPTIYSGGRIKKCLRFNLQNKFMQSSEKI